jgi:hypothetical protein
LPAKINAETRLGNTVAVIAATLLPGAVLGLPTTCAMLLPHVPLFALLYAPAISRAIRRLLPALLLDGPLLLLL